MVMWRWQNVLPKDFLKWSLRVLLVICCCQTPTLLVAGISVRVLNIRDRKKVQRNSPGHMWIEVNNEVHAFVVDDQDHPQMIKIQAELKRLSLLMHNAGYVPYAV
jgi:hypothetical protein